MSITRLQQARQLYAEGQRVAKTMDGSRPGYRGDDAARSSEGTSAGRADPGQGASRGDGPGPRNNNRDNNIYDEVALTGFGTVPGVDYSKVGPDSKFQKNVDKLDRFKTFRPDVPNIPLGPFSFITNLLNPGGKQPLQTFADFTAGINRPFFENVIRAGKIPGLNFATVADMTDEELEAAYQGYDRARLSGQIDAYGNPKPGYGKDQGDYSGIFSLADYDVFDNQNTASNENNQNTNSLFTSRFLQNQPEDIRKNIEASMQNYYTV